MRPAVGLVFADSACVSYCHAYQGCPLRSEPAAQWRYARIIEHRADAVDVARIRDRHSNSTGLLWSSSFFLLHVQSVHFKNSCACERMAWGFCTRRHIQCSPV